MGTNFDLSDLAEFSNFKIASDGSILVNFNGKRLKIKGAFISNLEIEPQINEISFRSERIFSPGIYSPPTTITMKCESFEIIGDAEYTQPINPIWSNIFS